MAIFGSWQHGFDPPRTKSVVAIIDLTLHGKIWWLPTWTKFSLVRFAGCWCIYNFSWVWINHFHRVKYPQRPLQRHLTWIRPPWLDLVVVVADPALHVWIRRLLLRIRPSMAGFDACRRGSISTWPKPMAFLTWTPRTDHLTTKLIREDIMAMTFFLFSLKHPRSVQTWWLTFSFPPSSPKTSQKLILQNQIWSSLDWYHDLYATNECGYWGKGAGGGEERVQSKICSGGPPPPPWGSCVLVYWRGRESTVVGCSIGKFSGNCCSFGLVNINLQKGLRFLSAHRDRKRNEGCCKIQ